VDLGAGGAVLTNTALASMASIDAIAIAAKKVLLIFILVTSHCRALAFAVRLLEDGPVAGLRIVPSVVCPAG